jgi:hypothetical protein
MRDEGIGAIFTRRAFQQNRIGNYFSELPNQESLSANLRVINTTSFPNDSIRIGGEE